jgi:hypothetical protein
MRFVAFDQGGATVASLLISKNKEIKADMKELKGTMKWQHFLSTFVLNQMCELVKSGVRTKRGSRRCI